MANDNDDERFKSTFMSIYDLLAFNNELFKKNNTKGQFSIPAYQRAYSWDDDNEGYCVELIDNIEDFICNNSDEIQNEMDNGDVDDSIYYILGSIILTQNDEDKNKINVVDGQQRITTLMLMLRALYLKSDDVLKKNQSKRKYDKAAYNSKKEILECLYQIDYYDIQELLNNDSDEEVKSIINGLDIRLENNSYNEDDIKIDGSGNTRAATEDFKTIMNMANGGLEPDDGDIIEGNFICGYDRKRDNRYTNYAKNFRKFYKRFFGSQTSDFGYGDTDNLIKLIYTILHKCKVVVLKPVDTNKAIEVFDSINSKGMELTDADVLSAELFQKCSGDKELEAEFKVDWKKIIHDSGEVADSGLCDIKDILNQYMYINKATNNDSEPRMQGVLKYFKGSDIIKDPSTFLKQFQTIIDNWKFSDEVSQIDNLKKILYKLNKNYRFYFASYMFYNKEKSDAEKIEFIEELLKLFIVYTYITSYDDNKSYLISNLNIDICHNKKPTEDLVKSMQDKINEITDNDKKIFCEKIITASGCKESLVYINDYLFARENGRLKDFNIVTKSPQVEHIMPQSWQDNKKHEWEETKSNLDSENFEEYLNKLGNKILLDRNHNIQAKDELFERKCNKYYKDAQGYPHAEIINSTYDENTHKYWTKEDIDNATVEGAKRIYKFVFNEAPMNEWLVLDYDVDDEDENALSTVDVDTARGSKKDSFRFDDAGIPVGSKLTLVGHPECVAVVSDVKKNKVTYNGVKYAISTLAEELLGKKSLQGARYWEYNGKKLTDIWNDLKAHGRYGKMNN